MTEPRARILTTSVGTNRGSFAPVDWALFLAISTIWGSSFLFVDIALEAFSPALITLLRIAFGAAVLWLLPSVRTGVEPSDRLRIVAISFLWVAIPLTLFPIAQQHINSAVTGMLNGAVPIFAAVISTLMLRRPPRGSTAAGLAIGLAGVVAISLPSVGEGTSQALGVALVLVATACYGLASNIAAPVLQRYGALPVMARMLALATLWTAPLGLAGVASSSFAWDSFLAVCAVGILGTGIAFVVMGTLVGRVGAIRASFIAYVIPVVAIVLGVVFRGDTVTTVALLGVALVIIGALLASRRET